MIVAAIVDSNGGLSTFSGYFEFDINPLSMLEKPSAKHNFFGRKVYGSLTDIIQLLQSIALTTLILMGTRLDVTLADGRYHAVERLTRLTEGAAAADDKTVSSHIKSVTVCESYPAEERLKASKKPRCDLSVMGSHERGVSYTFLSSVAKRVRRRSHVLTLSMLLVQIG